MKRIRLRRVPEGKEPRFPHKPTIYNDGDTLIMECELEAYPAPEIIWYHGEDVIFDSQRISMTKKATGKDTYLLKLAIKELEANDGGRYRCNACNIYGECNANIELNLQGTVPAPSR